MHVRICTADPRAGVTLYERPSEVGARFTGGPARDCQVRIQAETSATRPALFMGDGSGVVRLKEYPATPAGIYKSWVERDI